MTLAMVAVIPELDWDLPWETMHGEAEEKDTRERIIVLKKWVLHHFQFPTGIISHACPC